MSNIFDFLNYCLKKHKTEPIDEGSVSPYMLNRWLSMSDPDVAQIVNITQNRWTNTETEKDFIRIIQFYKRILPIICDKISYIKKPSKEEEKFDDDSAVICRNMEISIREYNIYKKMLSDLKN